MISSTPIFVVAVSLAFVLLILGEPGLAVVLVLVLTLGLAFEDRP